MPFQINDLLYHWFGAVERDSAVHHGQHWLTMNSNIFRGYIRFPNPPPARTVLLSALFFYPFSVLNALKLFLEYLEFTQMYLSCGLPLQKFFVFLNFWEQEICLMARHIFGNSYKLTLCILSIILSFRQNSTFFLNMTGSVRFNPYTPHSRTQQGGWAGWTRLSGGTPSLRSFVYGALKRLRISHSGLMFLCGPFAATSWFSPVHTPSKLSAADMAEE